MKMDNYLRQTKIVISWELHMSKTRADIDGMFYVAILKSAIGKCVCMTSDFVKFITLT